MDIKKACRSNKPIIKASRHLQLGVAGGRISPTHADKNPNPSAETLQREIDMLKQRLDRRNIKVSKVAEAWVKFYYPEIPFHQRLWHLLIRETKDPLETDFFSFYFPFSINLAVSTLKENFIVERIFTDNFFTDWLVISNNMWNTTQCLRNRNSVILGLRTVQNYGNRRN